MATLSLHCHKSALFVIGKLPSRFPNIFPWPDKYPQLLIPKDIQPWDYPTILIIK